MNYQINENELLYNRSSSDNKASYNYDQTFSKSKDGINDFNNMKNFKYSYPEHTSLESKEPVTRSKPAGAESRYSDDVLVTNKNTQEKFGTYTLASNREYPKGEPKKPSYEEKAKQYYQEARKADSTKDSRGAPGSISEIVDTNKVKTSKLFQKFVQNENKENPKKASQNDNSRQSPSPPRQQPKEQNKSKTPPPALSKNQPSRQEKNPAQGKNPYLKERNIPNLDLREGSMQYVKGSSTSRSPRQQLDYQQADTNTYDEDIDNKNQGINLNYHSSSKLVAMQMSEFPASINSLQNVSQNVPYQAPNLYSYLELEERAKHQQQQQKQAKDNNSNEIMVQRAQVMELSQTLTREVEAKKALENKCEELQSQLEKLAQISQNSKQNTLSRETEFQEIAFKAEEKVRSLNETLIEKAKQEDQHIAEINKLKRKLDLELESRGRLLEEHDELERSKYEEAERLNSEIKYKDEEIQRLKRDHDASKHDKDSFRTVEEKYVRDIKGLKSEIIELNRVIDDLRKTCDDKHQQINLGQIENSSLRDQLDAMESQYRDLLADNDKVKRENFGLKERLLAAESEIKTLRLSLDKAEIDANQTAEALSRTEKALEKERKLTSELKVQVSSELRHNQWEAPRAQRDRSSNRPYTASNTLNPSAEVQESSGPRYNQSEAPREQRDRSSNRPYTASNTLNPSTEVQESSGSRYNQWEAPREQRDRSSNRPYTASNTLNPITQHEEDRDQPYYMRNKRSQQQQQQDTFQPTKYDQKQEQKTKNVSFDQNDTYSQYARRGAGRGGYQQQQQQQPAYEDKEPKPRDSYGRESFRQGKDESIYTRMVRRIDDRVETNVQAPSENKYDERFRRGRETSKSNTGIDTRDNVQNDYEPAKPKLSVQNQLYSRSNPLTWEGDANDNKVGQNRTREYQSPPRGKSQTRQDNEIAKRQSPPSAKTQNFMREDIPAPNSQQVHALEMELMNLQMKKDNLTNEMQKLDKVKIKSGANIKKKQELESEMDTLQGSISNVKTKLRELNALHI